MHATLCPGVYGHIDYSSNATFSGWVFCSNDLRLVNDSGQELPWTFPIARPDVAAVYGTNALFSGFEAKASKARIQALVDGRWTDVLVLNDPFRSGPKKQRPLLFVEDHFYDDPDAVREFALQQEFVPMPTNRGLRTKTDFSPPWLQDKLKQIFQCDSIEFTGANGAFQYCTAQDPLVYHVDYQMYAGIVFLTPDAPVATGTSFYRDVNKLMHLDDDQANQATGKSFDQLLAERFSGGFYDSTKFEKVDTVGNVYNRLVIFNGHLIHSASAYFGTNKHDSRLFQLFFFNVIN